MRLTGCAALCAAGAVLLGACELTDVTIAVPADILVVEVVLRAGDTLQTAYLHGTLGEGGTARVFNASLRVHEAGTGAVLDFLAANDSLCLMPAPQSPRLGMGVCYAARGGVDMVKPGARYTLELVMPDDRRVTGSTTVPAAFEVVRPAGDSCALAPGTSSDIAWTRSAGASVYVGETRLQGLVTALRRDGVPVDGPDRDIDLLALAVGAADTSMTFPGDFGLFDRFDAELHGILLAIRDGLPAGVRADVAIAAADRNYVNWVRGGTFNPSGTVRLPSVQGQGTGVFGSLVIRRTTLHTGSEPGNACS
jgi:hypothetical protein